MRLVGLYVLLLHLDRRQNRCRMQDTNHAQKIAIVEGSQVKFVIVPAHRSCNGRLKTSCHYLGEIRKLTQYMDI